MIESRGIVSATEVSLLQGQKAILASSDVYCTRDRKGCNGNRCCVLVFEAMMQHGVRKAKFAAWYVSGLLFRDEHRRGRKNERFHTTRLIHFDDCDV